MTKMNRRDFLRTSGAAAAAASFAATPGLAWSQGVGTTAPFPDYKALVCVFLFGGNDSYNMVVPNTPAEYNAYAASRQNLAIPQQDLEFGDAGLGAGGQEFSALGQHAFVGNDDEFRQLSGRAVYSDF